MSDDQRGPVVLGLPQSMVDELALLVRDGRVVLSTRTRNVLTRGLSELIPRDRAVELRALDDADLAELRSRIREAEPPS